MRKRIFAMIIDYVIVLLISIVPLCIYSIVKEFNIFEAINSVISFAMCLMLLKDLAFRNASVGKKIMKIEIRKENNKISSIFTIILRNITIVIWPLECLLILLKKNRLGDIIFKTKVVEKMK